MDNSRTPTYDDVALYTLRDLGGLIQYNENNEDEDFIWFAITERMKESLCLFYYTLEFDPIPEKSSRYVVNVLCRSVPKNAWGCTVILLTRHSIFFSFPFDIAGLNHVVHFPFGKNDIKNMWKNTKHSTIQFGVQQMRS